jgi:DNA (cytosine-5)-methyltransferase 1
MTIPRFIDLFAGCGGLSLGLSLAGIQGLFAVERDGMAFKTFEDNFLSDREVPVQKFAWPAWLERRAWSIDDLLVEHRNDLNRLRGTIDVLAGGPPCQGFSLAGKRQASDPRNQLFEKYVQVVDAVRPRALVIENVPGMGIAHSSNEDLEEPERRHKESYYEKLKGMLEAAGYEVGGRVLDSSRYGVPQKRSRLIVLGLEKEHAGRIHGGIKRVFALLEERRPGYLRELGLAGHITASEAISDLRADLGPRRLCTDPESNGPFEEATYRGPEATYQQLMHQHCSDDAMDSMRLARHGAEVRERFAKILKECRHGVAMDRTSLARYGLNKQRIHPMSPTEPAPTITTLPDDVLHYEEPRILTVRECARLQSFPDWFRFRGKFTTGGNMRTKECPRYTQVGNAVPPHLGMMIGLAIVAALEEEIDGTTRPPLDLELG